MRAISDSGRNLGDVRDRVLGQVPIRRYHLILDLNAGTGLLTWESLRRVPEGSGWSLARDEQTLLALVFGHLAAGPIILVGFHDAVSLCATVGITHFR